MHSFTSFIFMVFVRQSVATFNTGLLLLQETAVILDASDNSKPHGKQVHDSGALPEVKAVLKNAERVFTDMNTRVASLEVKLEEAHQHGKESMKKSKVHYEKKLESQRKEMHATRNWNAKLRLEIEEMRSTNMGLKKKAQRLSTASNKLNTDMQELHGDVGIATEFIEKTLESSEELLVKAPEVQILSRLANLTENSTGSSSQKRRVEMLQQADPELGQPRELVHALLDSFDDLADEQAASEENLKKAFEIESNNITVRHKALLQEQVKLNETMKEESELHHKLHVAVKHLEKVHEQLLQRSQSLKLFVEHLGDGGQSGKHTMLIQRLANVSNRSRTVSNSTTKIEEKSSSGKTALPEVSAVLENSHKVFSAMSSQMAALEARLAEVQHRGALALSKQKAKYEAKLKTQRAEAQAMQLANSKISAEIEQWRRSNLDLRKKGEKLTAAQTKVNAEIKMLQGQVATAKEFIEKTLDTSEEMLTNASEVQILTELASADAVKAKEDAHKRHLQAVGMLQMSDRVQAWDAEEVKPQDMMQSFLGSFDDLAKEQSASEDALKTAFETAFAEGVERQKVLELEQTRLNKTKEDETALHSKLVAAVKHLEASYQQLAQRSRSLKLFVERLAGKSQVEEEKKVTALVQLHNSSSIIASSSFAPRDNVMNATKAAEIAVLPEVSTVLQNSHKVFSAMSTQMASLEAKLGEAQHQGALALSKQKAKYEAKLKTQRAEAQALQLMNAKTNADIEQVRRSNVDLRKKADKLMVSSKKLEAEMKVLQGQVSAATEFIDQTLDSSQSSMNASEVDILSELASADAQKAKEEAHKKRLQAVGMLQLSDKDDMQPKDMVQTLLTSFDDLAKEQSANEEALKTAFEAAFSAGEKQYSFLQEEQSKLNKTNSDEVELHQKLIIAVGHLEKSYKQLLQRAQSMKLFMDRLGGHGANTTIH